MKLKSMGKGLALDKRKFLEKEVIKGRVKFRREREREIECS